MMTNSNSNFLRCEEPLTTSPPTATSHPIKLRFIILLNDALLPLHEDAHREYGVIDEASSRPDDAARVRLQQVLAAGRQYKRAPNEIV